MAGKTSIVIFCLLLLAVFYWLNDVKGRTRWAFFFTVIGMNAILIYFGQQVFDFDGTARFFLSGVIVRAGVFSAVILPLGALAIKWLGLRFLYQHRLFFKV